MEALPSAKTAMPRPAILILIGAALIALGLVIAMDEPE
jgi:hypothetical protein